MKRVVAVLITLALVLWHSEALAQSLEPTGPAPQFLVSKEVPLGLLASREGKSSEQKGQEPSDDLRRRLGEEEASGGWRRSHHDRHRGSKALLWGAMGAVVGGAATAGVFLLSRDSHHDHRMELNGMSERP